MNVTNLDQVPGKKTREILGMVFSHASGESGSKEDPDKVFETLFEKARDELITKGSKLGAEALIGVQGKTDWRPDGTPEVTLMGTAISLEPSGEEEEEFSLTMDGESSQWSIPPATPSDEVVKLIRIRERSDRSEERERKDIYDLADEIGISYDKAKLLMDSGFRDLEDIADSSSRDISRINGINPTQARILRKRAKEIIDKEREL